jgi:hypothetical protein
MAWHVLTHAKPGTYTYGAMYETTLTYLLIAAGLLVMRALRGCTMPLTGSEGV